MQRLTARSFNLAEASSPTADRKYYIMYPVLCVVFNSRPKAKSSFRAVKEKSPRPKPHRDSATSSRCKTGTRHSSARCDSPEFSRDKPRLLSKWRFFWGLRFSNSDGQFSRLDRFLHCHTQEQPSIPDLNRIVGLGPKWPSQKMQMAKPLYPLQSHSGAWSSTKKSSRRKSCDSHILDQELKRIHMR